jgi:hypothetical protein
MSRKLRITRKGLSRSIIAGLTVYAFVNSYTHGVKWAQTWSGSDPTAQNFAYGTAAIPELLILSLVLRGRSDRKALIVGGVSVLWTLWVNGASAVGSASGFVVALFPPVAALLLLWLDADKAQTDEGSETAQAQNDVSAAQSSEPVLSLQVEPEPVTEPEPVLSLPVESEPTVAQTPVAQDEAQTPEPTEAQTPEPTEAQSSISEPTEAQSSEPVHLIVEPAQAQNVVRLTPRPGKTPKAQSRSVVSDGIKWLRDQNSDLTTAQIAQELGCSPASAKRIRAQVFGPARPSKADKTAQEG